MSTEKINYDYDRAFNPRYDRIARALETSYLNSTIPRDKLAAIAKGRYIQEMSIK